MKKKSRMFALAGCVPTDNDRRLLGKSKVRGNAIASGDQMTAWTKMLGGGDDGQTLVIARYSRDRGVAMKSLRCWIASA